MTNEQREAIDRLNKDKNKPLACGDIIICFIDDLDTVLSLIKEQQEEIVKLKVNLAKSCADRTLDRETLKNQENENLEALHRAYNEELDKKNKQIDLMADEIIMTKPINCTKTNEFSTKKIYMSKEEIKQYFERKVEDVKD